MDIRSIEVLKEILRRDDTRALRGALESDYYADVQAGDILPLAAIYGGPGCIYALGPDANLPIRGTGFDLNAGDDTGYTALMLAAMGNRRDIVHALIDAGADVDHSPSFVCAHNSITNSRSMDWRDRPILMAAQCGAWEIVEELRTHSKDEPMDSQGRSLADIARARGRADLAERFDAPAATDENTELDHAPA